MTSLTPTMVETFTTPEKFCERDVIAVPEWAALADAWLRSLPETNPDALLPTGGFTFLRDMHARLLTKGHEGLSAKQWAGVLNCARQEARRYVAERSQREAHDGGTTEILRQAIEDAGGQLTLVLPNGQGTTLGLWDSEDGRPVRLTFSRDERTTRGCGEVAGGSVRLWARHQHNLAAQHAQTGLTLLLVETPPKALRDRLQDLVAQYGRRTGRCGVCRRLLTDPKSITEGIGPVCKKKLDTTIDTVN